ncbi:MAG: APC family permease [Gemmatimonadota bacterium]|nr:APC family permease [Gemmatimonadota bacterium]
MSQSDRPTLLKTLGVFDGITMLVGITIGAGIFSAPQRIAAYFDSFTPILMLWILAGFFIFLGGLIYAELGARLPNTGGEYVYITRCFGPFSGFMFGWAQLFIIRTSPVAGLSIVTVDYLGHFVELTNWARTAAALGFVAVLGAINYIGIHRAGFYQKLSTVVKVTGLLVLVVVGLILVQDRGSMLGVAAPDSGDLDPVGSTIAAMMLIVFSYMGFERLGYSAEEMKDPKRTIPVSMFVGISVIIVIYISTNILYYQVFGVAEIREHTRVAADVATELLGPAGAAFIAIIVMVSATGSINGTMMTAPRVYYAMAHDGIFFRWFDHVHPIYRTPSHAIVAHCVWGAVILIVRGSFETIMAGMVFAVLIFFALNTLALFKLRREGVGGDNVYQLPLFPWLPGVYLFGILSLLIMRFIYEWQNSLTDLLFVASGLPFYLIWRRQTVAPEQRK